MLASMPFPFPHTSYAYDALEGCQPIYRTCMPDVGSYEYLTNTTMCRDR